MNVSKKIKLLIFKISTQIKMTSVELRSRLKSLLVSLGLRLRHYFKFIYQGLKKTRLLFKFASPLLSPIKSSAHWALWLTFLSVTIFITWAKFAVLPEVTVATATIIPLTHVQTIQNMEGGIIKDIPVHEGDIVEKGQVLVTLDPTRFISALDESHQRSYTLLLKIARLNAEVSDQPFIIPQELLDSKSAAIQSQIKAEDQLYSSHEDQIKQMKENLKLASQELAMTAPLVSEGAASPVEVLHIRRSILDLKNQIDQFYSRSLDQLATAKGDLSSLKAAMLALQDRLNRTTIRSSGKGIVKQIRIATIGSVVPPAAEIMSVVPLEDSLLVEAQVKPSDIGFIHAGESVNVKITAYDYSVYGGLDGYVDRVSADTITDSKGHSYYIVRVKTNKNYLRTPDNPLYIIPGMTATVSILTGKRTVLNYLLSPLIKAKDNALRER